MNKERLLKLADFLETVPPKRFEMDRFFGWVGKAIWETNTFDDLESDCGTDGCALGWATTIPEFKKAGFKAVKGQGPDSLWIEIQYGSWTGFSAAEKFFGIDKRQCTNLFGGRYDNRKTKPTTVAKQIRRLVESSAD